MAKTLLLLASVAGLLAVALGAFGAHGLRDRLSPELMSAYQTGVQYHFYHALALLGVAVLMAVRPEWRGLALSGWLFVAGMLLFSGSLYLLALTGTRWLGAVTPIGGALLLLAWATLAWAAARHPAGG